MGAFARQEIQAVIQVLVINALARGAVQVVPADKVIALHYLAQVVVVEVGAVADFVGLLAPRGTQDQPDRQQLLIL